MNTENGIDVDALGQATDTTFGRSSTVASATFSVKAKHISEKLLRVDYVCVITYAADRPLSEAKKKYDDESDSAINSTMKKIREEYKRISGKALKAKQVGDPNTNIEAVSISAFSPIRRGYYRRSVAFELG